MISLLKVFLFLVCNLIFYIVIYYIFTTYFHIYERRNDDIIHHLDRPQVKTMGGLFFWPSLIFLNNTYLPFKIIIYLASIYGIIDDWAKMKEKALSWKYGLFALLILGSIAATISNPYMNIGFQFFYITISNKIMYYIISCIYFVSLSISINITDGINGGLGIPTCIILITVIIKCLMQGIYEPVGLLLSLFTSIIVFLYFNLNNKLFMGNVGSHFIGALLPLLGLYFKMETAIGLMCLTFILSSLSNVIQILGKQVFNKKIFRFAPLHHHFELIGWSNSKILLFMSLITVIGCALSFFAC